MNCDISQNTYLHIIKTFLEFFDTDDAQVYLEMIAYLCEQGVPLYQAEIPFDSFDNELDNLGLFSVLRSETGTYTGFVPGGGVNFFEIPVGGIHSSWRLKTPEKNILKHRGLSLNSPTSACIRT